MGAGREVWVKIRASEAERAEWHGKARSVGLSLSDLVRRSVGRVRTWTVAHAELERKRTRELARIGSNLNQIARWANIHKEAQNQSSRHGPPSGGPDFQRPSNRAPATRVGVSKSLLGRCLCGFEASRTRRASTTSARRDRARPGVVSCSRFSSGATRNGEMRRQIGW